MDQLFTFQPFTAYHDPSRVSACHQAALDKLQTLYPGKRLTTYDTLTIGIETDSYYSETGVDTYELGLLDGEIPAMRNTRDGEVLTFRVAYHS